MIDPDPARERSSKHAQDSEAHLHQLAFRDELTGLWNRRGFLERFRQQSARAIRWDWPIAVLLLDLDHFWRVNDRFGKEVGDRALAEAASILVEAAGPLDNVARLFSDVFAVSAVAADLGQAKDLADRVVRGFRTHDWDEVQEGLQCTCSVGIAVVHPSRASKETLESLWGLLGPAEQAMRQVKQQGRNGYLCAEAGSDSESDPAD